MEVLHSIVLGQGEPLVVLHGFLGMGDNWKSLALKFSETYEVHLVDQRNHGRSFHDDDFSYEHMVDDLLNYMQSKSLKRINILGHSMGGKTGMLFAVEHPDLVHKLIVADIAPRFYPLHHQHILEALNAVDFEKVSSRNEIEEIFKKHLPEMGVRQFLLKNVYRNSEGKFSYRFNLEALEEQIDEVGVALPSRSVFEGPVLFLKGENSGYISLEDEGLIHAHFPKSEIISISNSGHWLHAENPIDFYNNVVRFLGND
jgi:pimeloyl-ACP methyl ester carboxylesterase